jgi:hypothetical protein
MLASRTDGAGSFLNRTTPNPIVLCSGSEYFIRALSASAFGLNGFENGVNSRPTYPNNIHCSIIVMGFP